MLNRMLTFSLLPVLLGFISLPLLAYLQASHIQIPNETSSLAQLLKLGQALIFTK